MSPPPRRAPTWSSGPTARPGKRTTAPGASATLWR
jgi:hypothetical protein